MVTTYTLVLAIGPASLHSLTEARLRLAIGKSAGNATPNVVWLASAPQALTTVRWDETYGVFAAEVPAASGAALRVIDSVHPAADRRIYPFRGDAFGEPVNEPRVPRQHYDVHNASPAARSFGLLQAATVNGIARRSPVNAVVLPPDFTADFTAGTKLYVWTQASNAADGAAAEVPDNATIVVLEPEHPDMAYHFDADAAAFVRAASEGTP